MIVSTILQIAALILFILAAVNVPSPHVALGWAGLACMAGSFLFSKY